MAVLEGNVAFANLDEHEEYQGQSTGKYSHHYATYEGKAIEGDRTMENVRFGGPKATNRHSFGRPPPARPQGGARLLENVRFGEPRPPNYWKT